MDEPHDKPPRKPPATAADDREARLAKALRDNLRRRKGAARTGTGKSADDSP